MEVVEIISKEPIMQAAQWPAVVVGSLAIAAIIAVTIWFAVTKKMHTDMAGKLIGIVGVIGIATLLIVMFISAVFFATPTGRYKYQAKINKDMMTVAQYEAFVKEHNPIIKDDTFYWEE